MTEMFYNRTYEKAFKKSDCKEDLGTTELFVVPEAQFCSNISQQDADNKAIEYAEVEGPIFANRVGGCCNVFYSKKQEGYFYSKKCPEGQAQETPTHFVVEAGAFWSTDSVEEANREARRCLECKGQAAADSSGTCVTIYYNEEQHGWFTKRCKPGWKGPDKYRRILAGTVSSFISVEDANEKAKEQLQIEGQEWVNLNTKCEPKSDDDLCSSNYEF